MTLALTAPRPVPWLADAVLLAAFVALVAAAPQPIVIAGAVAAGLCVLAWRHPHALSRYQPSEVDSGPTRFAATPGLWVWLGRLAGGPFRVAGWARGGGLAPVEPQDDEPEDDSVELEHCSPLVQQFLSQGRAALLLRPLVAGNLGPDELSIAQARLEREMAMVPQGRVVLTPRTGEEPRGPDARPQDVLGYLLDRCCVTNRQYQAFVDDGGYESMQLWDKAIWPAVLQFVDRTGKSGPRCWQEGRFPAGKASHPVVGISWYEAAAYARWAGKRLPSDAEWVRAAAWPVPAEDGRPLSQRYPWGDAMDRDRANVWGAGPGDTVSATAHVEGGNVAGVLQLIGNVWEWTSQPFGDGGDRIETDVPLKSIRGGAFDTYFATQATSQFQSGESPLARKHNIGFRCALSLGEVQLDGEPQPPAI